MGTVVVDFGGMWIRSGYINSAGTLDRILRAMTKAHRGGNALVADLTALIRESLPGPGRIDGIGIAVPTTINEQNCLDPSPNLPTISNFPLASKLATVFDTPVRVENDARCFVLGEWRYS